MPADDAVLCWPRWPPARLALAHLENERQRIETTIDPAALAAQQLYSALLNQETGVRGYALSGQPGLPRSPTPRAWPTRTRPRQPARQAAAAAAHGQRHRTQPDAHPGRRLAHPLREPTIKQIQASGKPVVSPDILAGKAEFDALRAKLGVFETGVASTRQQALAALDRASQPARRGPASASRSAWRWSSRCSRWCCVPPRSGRCTCSRPRPGEWRTATSVTRWPRPGRGRSAASPPT